MLGLEPVVLDLQVVHGLVPLVEVLFFCHVSRKDIVCGYALASVHVCAGIRACESVCQGV